MMAAPETPWMEAAKDTLMNIAAVSGVAVRDLRPAQTLVADLGLEDVELAILAEYQGKLAERLRIDAHAARVDAEAFGEDTVWQVLARTLCAAGVAMPSPQTTIDLLVSARSALRSSAGWPD